MDCARLRAQFDKTFVDMNPPDLAALPGLFFRAESRKKLVLLSITFSAQLWGRFLTCGGLSIRLPHLYAPATPLENRHHSLRLCRYAGQDGILRATQRVPRSTGAGRPVYKLFGRVTNQPQVKNLPHSSCRIPGSGKSMWHCALACPLFSLQT